MTTIRITQNRSRSLTEPGWSAGRVRRVLLACGILSSLLYAATDIIGGLEYPGYSFTAQAISELGAIGAPSEAIVAPMLAVYNVLVLAFGIAVMRTAAGNRALRVTGSMLIAYALIGYITTAGIPDPSYFKMQQRGAGGLATDAPHIILTSVLVLLLLVAMGYSAFALGMRFRIYSLGTILSVILFGALTGRFAPQVAAGQARRGSESSSALTSIPACCG